MVGVLVLKGLLVICFEVLLFLVMNILYMFENLLFFGLVDDIVCSEYGLIMLMGKGGVGKIMMVVVIVVRLVDMGFDVYFMIFDFVVYLSIMLNGSFKNLQVSCINFYDEIECYCQYVFEMKGRDLDEVGKWLLEEDLCFFCIEEIVVFQVFFCVICEVGKCFVVMDIVFIGYMLLLLDVIGVYY